MRNPIRAPILAAALGLAAGAARPGLAGSGPAAPAAEKPSYALVVTAAKRVHDELSYEFQAPKLRADEWVVYVARLPELPGQTRVRSALTPGGRPARDLSVMGRPLLVTRVPAGERRDGMVVRVEYEATLLERRLERLAADAPPPPAVPPLGPTDRKLALASGHQFDFETPAFRRWLDANSLRRGPEEAEVDLARRVFLAIKKGFTLAAADPERLLASRVCQEGKSDSGGLAIVFVSALRANRVPARARSGRWAVPSEEGRNSADEPHVKAEFFAARVGWVPVDLGSALALDKTPEGLDYFGVDDADFLTLHVDTDVVLDTLFFGRKSMTWLHAAAFWVQGSGSFEGLTAPVTSKIQVEPIDPPQSQKPAAPAADPAPRPREVAVSGIVVDKRDDWIEMRPDGEEDPVRYDLGPDPGRKLRQDWQGIFTVSRVRLVYRPDGDSRRLVSIKRQVLKAAGTVTGEVLRNNGWWVEVKPRNGPPDGYAVHFPPEKGQAVMEQLKDLKPGDIVTIQFTTDFERHRIETLRKPSPR